MAIVVPVDMEIHGYIIQLIQGELKEEYSSFHEALIKPKDCAPPTGLCIARTLSPVTSRKVIVQVMNFSLTPTTIYKTMRLGEATL